MASINLSTLCLPITTTNTTRLANSKVPKPSFHFPGHRFKLQDRARFCATSSSSVTPELTKEHSKPDEKFDWFSQWYPIAPVCDLDKKIPHAKRVMGIDLVVWWDRNESAWRAFDDRCPHRLAPLSEGRIDQRGRLQCVYHGWCFGGSGDCKLIPQSPPDSPPFHEFNKACVAAYPCTVQNGIVWFWPNADPHYKDILTQKAPPFIRELDDPSFTHTLGTRDFPYGYQVLVENLTDPAHIPYAHYGLLTPKGKNRPQAEAADREGGRAMEISVETMDINGFVTHEMNHESFTAKFVAPCLSFLPYTAEMDVGGSLTFSRGQEDAKASNSGPEKKFFLVFFCVPVSPGKSRLIWSFPRNFALWVDNIVPRWIFHLEQNLILDSDLYLLYMQEQKLMQIGAANWQKAYCTPTRSDAMVVGFRKWLTKYSDGEVNFGSKFANALLPPTPPREQLMDRYWSHVKNCKSCSGAYKGLKTAQLMLQVMSFGLVGFVVVAPMEEGLRDWLVSFAVMCFVGSKWLSRFIYRNFHYHDYDHRLL